MKGDTKGYYVGHKPCGCLVAVMVDMIGHEDDTAETLKEWKASGLEITFTEAVPDLSNLKHCTCGVLA